MIKSARNGGSITPPMSTRLTALVKAGRLTVLTETTVGEAQYDGEWTLRLDSHGQSTTMGADHVVLSTGSKLDVDSIPFLDTLRRDEHLKSELGFPRVDEGLQMRSASSAPLFFTGALAALQVRSRCPGRR